MNPLSPARTPALEIPPKYIWDSKGGLASLMNFLLLCILIPCVTGFYSSSLLSRKSCVIPRHQLIGGSPAHSGGPLSPQNDTLINEKTNSSLTLHITLCLVVFKKRDDRPQMEYFMLSHTI